MYHQCKTAGFRSANRRQFQSTFPPFMSNFRRPKYNVPLNIRELDTAYEVDIYATGFTRENIRVNVVDDVLFISGSKEISDSPKFSTQEFPIKNFERSLALNGLVDIENISAKVEEGILKLSLPKSPEAQKSEVNIEVQ